MSDYPRDRAGRQGERQRLVDEAVERARHDARLAGLSVNCEGDLRWGVDLSKHRCRNDGSGCLCECHDAAAADAQ